MSTKIDIDNYALCGVVGGYLVADMARILLRSSSTGGKSIFPTENVFFNTFHNGS